MDLITGKPVNNSKVIIYFYNNETGVYNIDILKQIFSYFKSYHYDTARSNVVYLSELRKSSFDTKITEYLSNKESKIFDFLLLDKQIYYLDKSPIDKQTLLETNPSLTPLQIVTYLQNIKRTTDTYPELDKYIKQFRDVLKKLFQTITESLTITELENRMFKTPIYINCADWIICEQADLLYLQKLYINYSVLENNIIQYYN